MMEISLSMVGVCFQVQHTNMVVTCNTLVVKPWTYDPSCDLCSLTLWTYDILYDCRIMILCIINVIKDL